MSGPPDITIVDILDAVAFGQVPPCADTRFDHRSCDYWEDEVRGLKSARPSWWSATEAPLPATPPAVSDNPFAPPTAREPAFNPFAPAPRGGGGMAWSVLAADGADPRAGSADNPFAPAPRPDARPAADAPRKLRLLTRGLGVFGSYAKVLTLHGEPAAYAQFGPLSAYPRARRLRELYASLPATPLPAVITCVATSSAARGAGLGQMLVEAVLADLAQRGFAAVEAYPDRTLAADQASAAHPAFWQACGFVLAVDDERYPVMRRALG